MKEVTTMGKIFAYVTFYLGTLPWEMCASTQVVERVRMLG